MATGLSQLKQSAPNNSLTYHRWMVGMDCRKDILNQNQVINKRILKKATPFNSKFKSMVTSNKMRIAYFFGFCAVFSLDKLYDWVILDNDKLLNLNKRISTLVVPKSSFKQEQNESKKIIKQAKFNQNQLTKWGKLFMHLDQTLVLDKKIMNAIRGQKDEYKKDYVNIGSFVEFFKDEEFESVVGKIRGEFPSLLLQI